MRLIDADESKKNIVGTAILINHPPSKAEELYKLIDSQPTAFDVKKVVEELEEELKLADDEKARCIKENPMQFDSAKGYANGIAVAIDIVKRGGRDD